MRKVFKLLLSACVLMSVFIWTGCSKSTDSSSSSSPSTAAVGTYTGNQLTWWSGNVKKYEGKATVKVTDLGNDRIRVESAEPSKYNFPVKEFKVTWVGDKVLTDQQENALSNNFILTTKTSPAQLSYGINFNSELVVFDGLRN